MSYTMTLRIHAANVSKEQLRGYGKAMRHEIYRICGVFQKQRRTFAYPYRYMSESVAWDSRSYIVAAAKKLYEQRMQDPRAKSDFIAVWPNHAYRIAHEQCMLVLTLAEREVMIPFEPRESKAPLHDKHRLGSVVLREKEDVWYADITMLSDA